MPCVVCGAAMAKSWFWNLDTNRAGARFLCGDKGGGSTKHQTASNNTGWTRVRAGMQLNAQPTVADAAQDALSGHDDHGTEVSDIIAAMAGEIISQAGEEAYREVVADVAAEALEAIALQRAAAQVDAAPLAEAEQSTQAAEPAALRKRAAAGGGGGGGGGGADVEANTGFGGARARVGRRRRRGRAVRSPYGSPTPARVTPRRSTPRPARSTRAPEREEGQRAPC